MTDSEEYKFIAEHPNLIEMPVKKNELSRKDAEYFAEVGEQQQKGMYYYIDQMKHNGMCYVKGIDHPVKLVPYVQTQMTINDFLMMMGYEYNKTRQKRLVKVLPVINE